MAVPKKRTSRRRKGMRRAHDSLNFSAAVVICETCGVEKLAHHICLACGYYRGRRFFEGEFDPSGEIVEGSESVDMLGGEAVAEAAAEGSSDTESPPE